MTLFFPIAGALFVVNGDGVIFYSLGFVGV